MTIELKQELRIKALETIYEACNGSYFRGIDKKSLMEFLNLNSNDFLEIITYLFNQVLIIDCNDSINLSHHGIQAYEAYYDWKKGHNVNIEFYTI